MIGLILNSGSVGDQLSEVIADPGLQVTTTWYMVLGVLVFTTGLVGVLIRRNALVMFMCIELMLNGANVCFLGISDALNDLTGWGAVLFVLVVAASEVVIGLALVVAIHRSRASLDVEEMQELGAVQ